MEETYLKEYYSNYDEEGRLLSKHGMVEYVTTMKYIHEYVQKGSSILEVGAGTGRYSLALAREGYHVTALELIEHNINVLKSKLEDEDDIIVEQGNALDLSRYKNESFDCVLILGPMYHLYSTQDKITALNEAKRVVKTGGIIYVAYCMNEATIITWAFKVDGSNLLECMQNNMLTSDFKCISKPIDVFELVRIEDINFFNDQCALKRIKIVGTDMYTNYIREQIDSWSDEVYNLYLQYHFTICDRQELIGLSHHVLDIIMK